MRIVRYFPWVLLGLALVPAFDRSSAPSTRSARAQVFATEPAPARPVAGLDLSKLPVGKVIGISPADAILMKALEKPAEFQLLCTQLGDFVKQVREKHEISVDLDLASLTADGKGAETILNKTIRNTTLRGALKLVLHEQGLTYCIHDGTLVILTKTAAETITPTRVYQVHDLVIAPNDPAARPDFNSLIELLSSTVQPESWREAGGTQGEIKWFEAPGVMALVITQTDEVHERIEQLLADLRAAKISELIDLQEKRDRIVRVPNQPATITLPAGSFGSGAGGSF